MKLQRLEESKKGSHYLMMTIQKARGTNSQVNFNCVSTKTSQRQMMFLLSAQFVNLETIMVVMIILQSISVKWL